MFTFPNIVFKDPVALIYHLFHIYFRLKYNLLYSNPSSTLRGSAVYDHHQVSSVLLKLLHCMSKFRTKDQILCLVPNTALRFCHWQSFKFLAKIHVFWYSMLLHFVFFALLGTLPPLHADRVRSVCAAGSSSSSAKAFQHYVNYTKMA
jgi:hypothetical protein